MRASRDPVSDLGARRYDQLAAEMLRSAGLEPFRLYRHRPIQQPGDVAPMALERPALARSLKAASPAEVGNHGQGEHDES
jgi:hypothetical protein